MVIVLALAFSLSAIVTIYTLFRSGDTHVPNVVGRPEVEAQKLAEQAGLRVKIQRRIDLSVPTSTVIETRPGPNSSVKKDSVLTIVVSSGATQTTGQVTEPKPSPSLRRVRLRNLVVETVKNLFQTPGTQTQ
jgi:beta-lactam-binding protein with PASTA domain